MTYVLIPGAGGAAYVWHSVEEELRERGRDAIAVQLPADDDEKGLADYAGAVVEAAPSRDDVRLVAQSMGAYAAALACDRLPVSLLVLVNPMIPLPGETAGQWWAATRHDEAIRESDRVHGGPADGSFDDAFHFLHDVPEAELPGLGATLRRQSGRPFADAIPAWPNVPVRMVTGRDDRFFPPAFQRRIARERLDLVPDELPGGHLLGLVNPTGVADLLERY